MLKNDLGSLMKIEQIPMPPSVNSIYFTRGKNRVLTTIGKTYKEDVKAYIIKEILQKPIPDLKNKPLGLSLHFYFKTIENKSYAKTDNRFKRIDVSNRIKILEDAISETLGIDDCQFIFVFAKKETSQNNLEYVTVEILNA